MLKAKQGDIVLQAEHSLQLLALVVHPLHVRQPPEIDAGSHHSHVGVSHVLPVMLSGQSMGCYGMSSLKVRQTAENEAHNPGPDENLAVGMEARRSALTLHRALLARSCKLQAAMWPRTAMLRFSPKEVFTDALM